MREPDLSIIITFHKEGLYAYKTIQNVFASLPTLDKNKISYEIILHADNADDLTLSQLKKFSSHKEVSIYKNTFGDVSSSRNFCVNKARGKYLSFIDGDDLVSLNWFYDSYKLAHDSKKPIVVHPEANLTFGRDLKEQVLWLQKDSINKTADAIISVTANRWISTCTGLKEIFINHPYFKTGNGYGNEDYWFNTETLAHDISHFVAKGTVQFYRRKANSVFTANLNSIQPYSELFDIDYFKTMDINSAELREVITGHSYDSLYNKLSRAYRRLRQNEKLNRILTPLAYKTVNVIRDYSGDSHVPEFVIKEWKNISKIESTLYPTKDAIRSIVNYDSEAQAYVGKVYYKMVKDIPFYPNYVFIVPWVTSGGADKVLINYLKAFKELHPKWKIAVITTVPSDNKWSENLPDNTYLIDFANKVRDLAKIDQEALFSRIVTQLKCKRLHIINSEFGYDWAAKHLDLIKNHYTLSLSLFCHDIIPHTKGQGIFDYANPYLLDIYPAVNHIYTDNQAVIDRVVRLDGFDENKFTVEYQPNDLPLKAPELKKSKDGKFHILWASRITEQKAPWLLKEIAKKLSPEKFQIDVYGRVDGEYHRNYFKEAPVIHYRGSYNGIQNLDTSEYQLFLYTSMIDGLPNILLEISALGLPIIASDAGGIKEFIKEGKTGRLISDYKNPDDYIKAIKEAAKNPEEYLVYAKNAQKLLEKQHSVDVYLKKIKEDF